MNLCGTCSWWQEEKLPAHSDDREGILSKSGLRLCTKMVEIWNATEWVAETDEDDLSIRILPKYEDRLAFTQDGSSYKASLLTKAEFGCVMHEKNV